MPEPTTTPVFYLRIEGCLYEVQFDRLLDTADKLEGWVSESHLQIRVDTSMPLVRREETLFHELLHLLTNLGGEASFQEEHVDRLSRRLFAVLRDNGLLAPDLFAALQDRWREETLDDLKDQVLTLQARIAAIEGGGEVATDGVFVRSASARDHSATELDKPALPPGLRPIGLAGRRLTPQSTGCRRLRSTAGRRAG